MVGEGQFKVTIEANDASAKTKVSATRQFRIPGSGWTRQSGDIHKLSVESRLAAEKMLVEQITHMTKPVLEAYFVNQALAVEEKKENRS